MNKCTFCRKECNVLNDTYEYSGLEFALLKYNRAAVLRVRYFPKYGHTAFTSQDIVPINFCPKCGRRLRKET